MFEDLLLSYREPAYSEFNAVYYTMQGPAFGAEALDALPPDLRPYVEYTERDSGTGKFLPLLYDLATRSTQILECGVWQGTTTVAFALGLRNSGGQLTSVDLKLQTASLEERVKRHQLNNVQFFEMNDLEFTPPEGTQYDVIYIDSSHVFEHTLRELFYFDEYLKPGGVFVLHDLVSSIGLLPSMEDSGYENVQEIHEVLTSGKRYHITEVPVWRPNERCTEAPVSFAIQRFLGFRPNYKLFRNLDWAGMGIIWKLPR